MSYLIDVVPHVFNSVNVVLILVQLAGGVELNVTDSLNDFWHQVFLEIPLTLSEIDDFFFNAIIDEPIELNWHIGDTWMMFAFFLADFNKGNTIVIFREIDTDTLIFAWRQLSQLKSVTLSNFIDFGNHAFAGLGVIQWVFRDIDLESKK